MLSPDDFLTWVQSLSDQPVLLAAALIVATFVTEDGALITGSLLVGSGVTSPLLAITALSFGIAIGDVGLYGVGWTAREFRFLRRRLPIRRARKLRGWLNARKTPVLFCSRFLPGTRLPTYLTFGFLRLPLCHFATVMTVAALVWVSVMVLFVSSTQRLLAPLHGGAGLLAGFAAALLLIALSHRLVRRSRLSVSIDNADAPAGDTASTGENSHVS